MAAFFGNAITVGVVGFLLVAVLSLLVMSTPATPAFARRSPGAGAPQLRHDTNAGFLHDRGFLFRRRCWFVGTCCPPVRIDMARYGQLSQVQGQRPVSVAQNGGRVWWWFEGDFYWESARYAERDVLALVRDRQRKAAQRLDRAHMLLNIDEGRHQAPRGQRQTIPREVRRAVFERDGGQCVECGSNFDIQYDHLIPVALGGATTVENLQILCGPCNREKAANL